LFAERLRSRGVRAEMGFEAYEGPSHIRKFFSWLRHAHFNDMFRLGLADELEAAVLAADQKVFGTINYLCTYGLCFCHSEFEGPSIVPPIWYPGKAKARHKRDLL
jgi:hypothetical protein